MRGVNKRFSLFDVLRFAAPSHDAMDVDRTARNIRERLGGRGFLSYNPIPARLLEYLRSGCSELALELLFSSYKKQWKNQNLQDVTRLLGGEMGRDARWYPFPARPRPILGLEFWPTVNGVLYKDGMSRAVIINPRKGQPVSISESRFVLRGGYEEHCISDPADPVPGIYDCSEFKKGEGRKLRISSSDEIGMCSLDEFESIVDCFFEAVVLAGYEIPYVRGAFSADLFRNPR